MPKPIISREQVHAWSEAIGHDPLTHQAALQRLLKSQRRISRFVEENAESMDMGTGGVAMYLIGVILRLFDLAGGELRAGTWAHVRDAEARVQEAVPALLPLDDGLPERARAISWRAQPHILDEALMALFERTPKEGEQDLDHTESFKVYMLMWVAVEVLNANWKAPKGLEGEKEYTYVHIDPNVEDEAPAAT
jgi:hypothetical protein